MSLANMLKKWNTPIEEISAYLDGLAPPHRVAEVANLGLLLQARLYGRAAAAMPISLEHFVPPDTPDLTEVVHHGRNSMPLFTRFEKRFCRAADGSGSVFGYNEGPTRSFLGPGFFVVHGTHRNPAWYERGAVVIDYFLVPDGPLPRPWPQVVPNEQGLQRYVYAGTRDFMRLVSRHVAVGRAYKKETPLPAYFVLCRDEPWR